MKRLSMKWFFYLFILMGIVIVVLLFLQTQKAEARRNPKINICHKTQSEHNPYNAIRVDDDGYWNGHNEHEGDFLYEGPVRENGHPTRDGDEWCEENVPREDGEDEDNNHDEDGDKEDGQEATPSATIDEGEHIVRKPTIIPTYSDPICTATLGKPILLIPTKTAEGLEWSFWGVDGADHYSLSYGYSSDKLEFGVPEIQATNKFLKVETKGLDTNKVAWGQITAYGQGCSVKSDLVDP